MASHERLLSNTLICSQSLLNDLATLLPKDSNFKIYHLSTPPTKTSSLYSAPPDTRPDRTYCESHFLTASIRTPTDKNLDSKDVLVFAIEILIYSTAHDTTFFISKADSTGYLHLLGLPKGTPSPIRDISVTFLRHLLKQHERPNIRCIVSLFARAQDQYLFPGSIEYSGKHVLDDRGLVRWWCRVLDPLIEDPKTSELVDNSQWSSIKGYLIVPGLDTHETSSYTPKKPGSSKTSWTIGHPLKEISTYSKDVPPRCLIPHYPDDPKARFLDELDEEITKGRSSSSGQWKSVRSIDQFWEMMAFRQECSAGRLVGFIWIVFEPRTQQGPTETFLGDSQSTTLTNDSNTWDVDSSFAHIPELHESPTTSFCASSQPYPTSSSLAVRGNKYSGPEETVASEKTRTLLKKKKKKLSGPIIPRQPKIKTEQKSHLEERPENTAYYVWRPEGRGQVVVEESDYKRITELLLRLDFANLGLATSSTARWVSEVRSGAPLNEADAWGQTVIGTKITEIKTHAAAGGVNTLNLGLVRKKRKVIIEDAKEPISAPAAPAVNVLGASMIRKKPKV